jgi:hypothetical protein
MWWYEERLISSTANRSTRAAYSTCCDHNQVRLEPLPPPPPELLALLTDAQSAAGAHYRANIRMYNNAFQFVSVGAQRREQRGPGVDTYVIQGALHHRSGSLLPAEGDEPVFAQIYVLDGAEQIERRVSMLNELSYSGSDGLMRETVNSLQRMLERTCPFLPVYRTARQRILEYVAAHPNEQHEVALRMPARSSRNRQYDGRTAANEIAMAVLDPERGMAAGPDLLLQLRAGGQHNGIMRLHDSHR